MSNEGKGKKWMHSQLGWGVPSSASVSSGSAGSSVSTYCSSNVGSRPVARACAMEMGMSITQCEPCIACERIRTPVRTCQQSVMNSSQNSARRFCVSAVESLKRDASRSASETPMSHRRTYSYMEKELTKAGL